MSATEARPDRDRTTRPKTCGTCKKQVVQYTYVCGTVECLVCWAERVVTDAAYNQAMVVHEIIGVERPLLAFESSSAQIGRAFTRRYVSSLGRYEPPHVLLSKNWVCGAGYPAVFEVVSKAYTTKRPHRAYFAVLPAAGPSGKPWAVRLGDDARCAYALSQWVRGMLTMRELVAGVYSAD